MHLGCPLVALYKQHGRHIEICGELLGLPQPPLFSPSQSCLPATSQDDTQVPVSQGPHP